MPEPEHALYSRGKYRLEWDRRRDGSLRTPYLQIVWYDPAAGRSRSRSTGTDAMHAAEQALDRLYLERERGQKVCPSCGQAIRTDGGYPLSAAIADYLVAREDRSSIGSIRPRLGHFLDFIAATGREGITCEQVDETAIETFRKWALVQPVTVGEATRQRSPGTVEATVRILAAVINHSHRRRDTLYPAGFTALAPRAVSRTPTFRADVRTLASMFSYCLNPQPPQGEVWSAKGYERQRQHRESLLRFLQVSVATWCRPDAAHDLSADPARDQWISHARVVQMNPRGRTQTKKYRPAVPVPEKFARLLDRAQGFYVPVKSVRKAFEAMQRELGLPGEREAGMKLLRRSVAQIARQRIGEERWAQGEMMLGHRRASTSDLYALFDPANLGVALAVTGGIIDEIEALAPGAFTGPAPELQVVAGGLLGAK